MRRRLLPLVLAIALGAIAAPGIAGDSDTQSPAAAAADVQGITGTVAGDKVNVRFGPSTNSRPVVTLHAGDAVEILGAAQVPDWYVIRFPSTGHAWVDGRNLQPVDGGKRWRVMTDGTKARDDAKLGGSIVAELAKGEIIEDRNQSRDAWHAVYVPSAVAYISKKYVTLPDPKAIEEQKERQQKADLEWQQALAEYRKLYELVKQQPDAAADVDTTTLLQELDDVSKAHADAEARQTAKRLHEAVADVVRKAKDYREAHPGQKAPPVVAANTTGGSTGSGEIHHVPTGEKPLEVPEGVSDQTQPAPAKQQPLPSPQAPAASFTAVGFISENTDYPKVGVPNLLLDGNSKVVAFLTPKPGSAVNLAEYYWRWVGVSGTTKDLDPALHGLGTKVPLIEVESVQLQKK